MDRLHGIPNSRIWRLVFVWAWIKDWAFFQHSFYWLLCWFDCAQCIQFCYGHTYSAVCVCVHISIFHLPISFDSVQSTLYFARIRSRAYLCVIMHIELSYPINKPILHLRLMLSTVVRLAGMSSNNSDHEMAGERQNVNGQSGWNSSSKVHYENVACTLCLCISVVHIVYVPHTNFNKKDEKNKISGISLQQQLLFA